MEQALGWLILEPKAFFIRKSLGEVGKDVGLRLTGRCVMHGLLRMDRPEFRCKSLSQRGGIVLYHGQATAPGRAIRGKSTDDQALRGKALNELLVASPVGLLRQKMKGGPVVPQGIRPPGLEKPDILFDPLHVAGFSGPRRSRARSSAFPEMSNTVRSV